MTFERYSVIPATHPSLPGHFPDSPIVPGVVILDEVFAAVGEWLGNVEVIKISTVKFLSPLKPEQSFRIELCQSTDQPVVDFRALIDDQAIVQGRLLYGRKAS